ncbi:Bgt-20364, partial [Blumeria graminis f. sp. tritici]
IWNTLNLIEEMQKCPDKLQAFNNLERELRRVQRGLEAHSGDASLRTRIINACSGV